MVNMVKSAIFFNANCDISVKDSIKQTLSIVNEALGEKYFGLPTAVRRSMKEAFEPILGKIRGLMGGWSKKLLSCATRETLIKSIAQTIPTYSMSCFYWPQTVARKLHQRCQTTGVVVLWIAEECIGRGGLILPDLRLLEAWASKIFGNSI
jgi:hypothetical protein